MTSQRSPTLWPKKDARSGGDVWTNWLIADRGNCDWVPGVEKFKYAPFASTWTEVAKEGSVVEILNPCVPQRADKPVYWFGTLEHFAGYSALVKFHSIDESDDEVVKTWIPLCSKVPKPFGHCLANDILLWPVREVDRKVTNFLEKTYHALDNKKKRITMPFDHAERVRAELHRCSSARFKMGEIIEAMDYRDCSKHLLGHVTAVIGDRIHVMYMGVDEDDEGFWFNQHSELIHKLGWSRVVGADLKTDGIKQNLEFPIVDKTELGGAHEIPPQLRVKRNMVFEMRHPIFPHKIVAGYVAEVLKHGYILASSNWANPEELIEIVLHLSSDYILPINFCRDNGIVDFEAPVEPEQQMTFVWRDFLKEQDYKGLDVGLIKKGPNKLSRGCKVEAVMLLEPTFLGAATVTRAAGRLVLLHFDGYSRNSKSDYQWMSCESPDMYPAGYANLIGHRIGNTPDPVKREDTVEFVTNSSGANDGTSTKKNKKKK